MAKAGAPTKYKKQYDVQAYKMCLLGATDAELADFFEVDESTINNWKLKHPEFLESIRAGKRISDMEAVNSLFNGCFDRVIVEEQAIKLKSVTWKDGKKIETERVQIVQVKKAVPSDFRNQQFWLKNRQPDKWRDKTEVDQNVRNIDWQNLEMDLGIDNGSPKV